MFVPSPLARSAHRLTAAASRDRCLGCPGCTGPCHALRDLLSLPDIVLK